MATKSKRVTYNDHVDDNTDYLVPLPYDSDTVIPTRTNSSKNPAPTSGLFGSIFFLTTLVLYGGVPTSKFVIGLIYINKCTVQQFISTYMILSGAFGIALVVVGFIIFKKANEPISSHMNSRGKPLLLKILIPIFVVLLLFVIAWFFVGQVVVFEVKTYVEFFDPVLPEYCHGNLYKAAYILIFVDYLIFLIGIILNVLSCLAPPEQENNKKTKRPTRNNRK